MIVLAQNYGFVLVFSDHEQLRQTLEALNNLLKLSEEDHDEGPLTYSEIVTDVSPDKMFPYHDKRLDQIKGGRKLNVERTTPADFAGTPGMFARVGGYDDAAA